MYGMLAVFGPLSKTWQQDVASEALGRTRSRTKIFRATSANALIIISTPTRSGKEHGCVHFADAKLTLILDGYLLVTGKSTDQSAHLRQFGLEYLENGLEAALTCISAGAFRLAILDEKQGFFGVVNDAFGSVPLFVARSDRSVLLSTNPMALREAPGISSEVDWTGIASWTVFGYPIGDRFLHTAVRTVPAGTLVQWEESRTVCSIRKVGLDTERIDSNPVAPPTQIVASLLGRAVQRIADVDQSCAHLQSGGMDSRAILAAWPEDNLPTCYTYGVPESAEVIVAKRIAETKGAELNYWQSTADQVADALEDMYQGNGLFIYPDRYLIGKRIAADGHAAVVDGFLGDVLLGGTYFANIRYFPSWSSMLRLVTRLVDQPLSSLSSDAVSQALYDEICELKSLGVLEGLLSPDFVNMVREQEFSMLDDIHREVVRLRQVSDSLSLFFRDFLIANRGRHSIAQQAVMCRQHVEVGFPFTNDFEFLRTTLAMLPRTTAYRRYYMKLFRECFADFARIPYGATMLPLTRPPIFHRWASLLSSRGVSIPGVTGSTASRVKPVNWNAWLSDSSLMREIVLRSLTSAGIGGSGLCDKVLKDAIRQRRLNGGKLMHIAGVARWID